MDSYLEFRAERKPDGHERLWISLSDAQVLFQALAFSGRGSMNTKKIPARIVERLDNIRGAVAKMHEAHVDNRPDKVCVALHTINNEYFSIREYLRQLAEDTEAEPVQQSLDLTRRFRVRRSFQAIKQGNEQASTIRLR